MMIDDNSEQQQAEEDEPKPVWKGRIVEWNEEKGEGFIAPEHGGDNIFVHCSALGPTPIHLRSGLTTHRDSLSTFGLMVLTRVSYEELYDKRALTTRADNVEKAEEEEEGAEGDGPKPSAEGDEEEAGQEEEGAEGDVPKPVLVRGQLWT